MALNVSKANLDFQHCDVTVTREFGDFVSFVTESLCVDFPMYLARVATALKLTGESSVEHSVLATSFYAQLLLTAAVVDTSLLDLAIEMLLLALKTFHQGHEGHSQPPILRVICVHGLSGYKLDSISKMAALEKHSFRHVTHVQLKELKYPRNSQISKMRA